MDSPRNPLRRFARNSLDVEIIRSVDLCSVQFRGADETIEPTDRGRETLCLSPVEANQPTKF
jgi:hypothetical protein